MATEPALPAQVLARWQQDAGEPSAPSWVLPDGCRDLILRADASRQQHWALSHLADSAYEVPGSAGTFWLGYRLQPGAIVDSAGLLAAAAAIGRSALSCEEGELGLSEERRVAEAIADFVRIDARVCDALEALASAASVAGAANALGVSERTLERLMLVATGRSPRFWRALARVRRAAQTLGAPEPVAAIAADHGFADQAHFSRECLRWLGRSPSRLRTSPALLQTVAATGYG